MADEFSSHFLAPDSDIDFRRGYSLAFSIEFSLPHLSEFDDITRELFWEMDAIYLNIRALKRLDNLKDPFSIAVVEATPPTLHAAMIHSGGFSSDDEEELRRYLLRKRAAATPVVSVRFHRGSDRESVPSIVPCLGVGVGVEDVMEPGPQQRRAYKIYHD
jgi:hypothetical protein